MADLVLQTEILLHSNMLGPIILVYLFLLLIAIVSFVNIYSVDKIEFLYNEQRCLECKHPLFFIIMYSKNKRIISIKTFVLELIGYFLLIITITAFCVSLYICVNAGLIIMCIVTLINIVFGCITAGFFRKAKKLNYK